MNVCRISFIDFTQASLSMDQAATTLLLSVTVCVGSVVTAAFFGVSGYALIGVGLPTFFVTFCVLSCLIKCRNAHHQILRDKMQRPPLVNQHPPLQGPNAPHLPHQPRGLFGFPHKEVLNIGRPNNFKKILNEEEMWAQQSLDVFIDKAPPGSYCKTVGLWKTESDNVLHQLEIALGKIEDASEESDTENSSEEKDISKLAEFKAAVKSLLTQEVKKKDKGIEAQLNSPQVKTEIAIEAKRRCDLAMRPRPQPPTGKAQNEGMISVGAAKAVPKVDLEKIKQQVRQEKKLQITSQLQNELRPAIEEKVKREQGKQMQIAAEKRQQNELNKLAVQKAKKNKEIYKELKKALSKGYGEIVYWKNEAGEVYQRIFFLSSKKNSVLNDLVLNPENYDTFVLKKFENLSFPYQEITEEELKGAANTHVPIVNTCTQVETKSDSKPAENSEQSTTIEEPPSINYNFDAIRKKLKKFKKGGKSEGNGEPKVSFADFSPPKPQTSNSPPKVSFADSSEKIEDSKNPLANGAITVVDDDSDEE